MHKSKSPEPKLESKQSSPDPPLNTVSPEYAAVVESLSAAHLNLQSLRNREAELQARCDQIGDDREELLRVLADDDTPGEDQIEDLTRLSARFDVTEARLKNVQTKVRQAEDNLQRILACDFCPPFERLFRALLAHRFNLAKLNLLEQITPSFRNLVSDPLVWKARSVVEVQQLEIFLPTGFDSPLNDTFQGSGWSQHRPNTMRLVESAVEAAIPQAFKLLDAVALEAATAGFSLPPFSPPSPEPPPAAEPLLYAPWLNGKPEPSSRDLSHPTQEPTVALPAADQADWSQLIAESPSEALTGAKL